MQEGHRHQKLRVTGHIAHHHKWLATFLPYQNPERRKLKPHLEEGKNKNVIILVKLYNVLVSNSMKGSISISKRIAAPKQPQKEDYSL
jgi:hypothetical protein